MQASSPQIHEASRPDGGYLPGRLLGQRDAQDEFVRILAAQSDEPLVLVDDHFGHGQVQGLGPFRLARKRIEEMIDIRPDTPRK